MSENQNVDKVTSDDNISSNFSGFLPITIFVIFLETILILAAYFLHPKYNSYTIVPSKILVISALIFSFFAIITYLLRNRLSSKMIFAMTMVLSVGACYLIALGTNNFVDNSWLIVFPSLLTVVAGTIHLSSLWWKINIGLLWLVWILVRFPSSDSSLWIQDGIVILFSITISYLIFRNKTVQLDEILTFTNTAVNNSQTDPMTGLLNRRGLTELGATKAYLAHEEGDNVAVTLLDVNGLKKINDSYGHEIGDDGILLVAETLKATTRKNDWVARWGGDEFVILSYGKEIPTGEDFLYRFNTYLENYAIRKGHVWVPSISVGQASVDAETNFSLTNLLVAADESMYEMKEKVKKTKSYNKNATVALGTGIRETDMPKIMKTADKNL